MGLGNLLDLPKLAKLYAKGNYDSYGSYLNKKVLIKGLTLLYENKGVFIFNAFKSNTFGHGVLAYDLTDNLKLKLMDPMSGPREISLKDFLKNVEKAFVIIEKK